VLVGTLPSIETASVCELLAGGVIPKNATDVPKYQKSSIQFQKRIRRRKKKRNSPLNCMESVANGLDLLEVKFGTWPVPLNQEAMVLIVQAVGP
jgi:hypothetical protein